MENLNRLKAVLAESGKMNKWLAEQLGKDPATISKSGVRIYTTGFINIV